MKYIKRLCKSVIKQLSSRFLRHRGERHDSGRRSNLKSAKRLLHPKGFAMTGRKRFYFWTFIGGLLVILVPIAISLFQNPGKAEAWFNEDWLYRASIPITAHTSAENNVYITVTLDTATPITASKMQSDCGDLRFTKKNGEILPYFINASPGCNNAATTIQVNFDSFPAGAQTIYYYYGNASAPNGFNASAFSTAATGVTIGSAGSEEQGKGPVAYWKFDEGQGTTAQDVTITKKNGTLGGTTVPTWQTESQCVSGKCLFFDGSTSKVTGAGSGTVNGIKTLSFWLRPNTIATQGIIDLDGGTHKINTNSSGVISAAGFTSPTYYINGVSTTSLTLTLNQWNHVEITTGTAFNSSSTFTVGTDGTNFIKGFIDEVKIYNYTRSAAQVKQDYTSGIKNAGTKQGTSAVLGSKPQDYLSNGLVGYWKMDESSSTAADSSGNSLTLTNNGTTTYAVGKYGNASNYNGSTQYLNTATAINGIQTVSFWANPAVVTTNYFINLINSSAYITVSSGTISATGFTNPTIYVNGTVSSTISASAWSLVTITTGTAINANAFATGLTNDGSNHFYTNTSKMDEVRVYNRALSPAEISQLYNFAPGPVGYWNFEEGTGTTTNDTSGNGYSGTITGATYQTGKFGKALNFNGSTDAVGSISSISGINTVSFWVNPSSTTANLIDLQTSPGTINISASSGTISAAGFTSPTYYVNGIQTASPTLTANTWQYITVTSATAVTGSALRFGRISTTSLTGKLDEIKIYNYARTQKQIVEDMNVGHPAVGSPVGSAVGHWKFDEGADNTCSGGTNDACNSGSTGRSLDGAFAASSASPSISNSGKFGKALSFDGGDYLTVPNNAALNPTDAITVGGWIYMNTLPSSGNLYQLAAKTSSNNGHAEYDLAVYNNSGTMQVYWRMHLSASLTAYTMTVNYNFFATTWYHIIGIYDSASKQMNVYVNGVAIGTPTSTLGEAINTGTNESLYIGAFHCTNCNPAIARYMNGLVDELKIYNYALTSYEVKTEYNRGSSMVLGALGSNSSYQSNAANQEYCIPGDSTSCNAPTGEYKFEKGDCTDTSGNGYNGTMLNSPTQVNGKIGKALAFTNAGGSYCNLGASSNFVTASAGTMDAWVYPTGTADSRSNIYDGDLIVGDNGGYFGIVRVNFSGSCVGGETGDKIYVYNWDGNADCFGITYSANQWVHITWVHSGGTLYLYKNGVSQGSVASGNTSALTGNMMFSRGDGAPQSTLDGYVDETRIYNYARSAAQIAWDYNRGKPVGHWDLDECQGASANDSSGNGNTGTITIGATGTQTTGGTCTTPTDGTGAWYNGVSGKRNYSLKLDGTDDKISVTDTANLRFDASTLDFSLSAWVKRTTTGTEYIISKEDADNDGYRLLFTSSNTVQCSEDLTDVTSTSTITDTNWHLVGCTIDRDGNGQIYIDGRADGSAVAMGTDAMATTSNITFGTRSYTSTSYLNGQIDDVRVYNYALTGAQVKDLYNGGAINFGPATGAP